MSRIPKPAGEAVKASRKGLRRVIRALRRVEEGHPPSVHDVWKWTGRKYQVRIVVLLLVNALLFAGLCCFTYWLRSGEFTLFTTESYWSLWWQNFDPFQETQVTLIDFLMYPIPVDQVPMMMVIFALIMASLTAIPILVSMLYRFPFSLIFTFFIAFVAVMPWLAVYVTLCCYLARWRRIQFSFRYATALISLLPIVAYYIVATRNAGAAAHVPPVEQAKLYVPWIFALIAACTAMAIVLAIARVVNHRPGAIAPLLGVMFVTPIVLFLLNVGADELYYHLLENQFGFAPREYAPADVGQYFIDQVDVGPAVNHIAAERYETIRKTNPQATLESVKEQVQIALQFQLASIHADERNSLEDENCTAFAWQQEAAVRRCRQFLDAFPNSRYVPNALYLAGRTLDMRVDQAFFARTLMLRHYHDFPNAASRKTWETLYAIRSRYPASPFVNVAAHRLALLDAREGRVDHAIDLLKEVIERLDRQKQENPPLNPNAGWKSFLARRPASSTLDVQPPAVVQDARKLLDLLTHNRDHDQNDLALCELLKLDPNHPLYADNLRRLLADLPVRCPRSRLGDNLEVMLASTERSDSLRIDRLKVLITRLAAVPDSDALPRARFELGAAYQADNRPDEARAAFKEVLDRHAASPWAYEADRRLSYMHVTGRAAG